MNKVIKKIINKQFKCKECEHRNYCEFWKGYNMPCDCTENCFATEAAEGIEAAFKYLASIPWDKAMHEIVEVNNELKEE